MMHLPSSIKIFSLVVFTCLIALVPDIRALEEERGVCKRFPLDLNAIKVIAKNGDSYCQAVLGAMLWRGIKIERDEHESLLWSRRSWEAGEPLGFYNKGVFLKEGMGGLEVDPEGASQAYRAARKGMESANDPSDPHYEFSLGYIIGAGSDGTKKNSPASCKRYLNAANSGHPLAQWYYGRCQEYGLMGSRKPDIAAVWYERAAANGFSSAAWSLGKLHEAIGDREKARHNFERAAEIGDSDDKLRWGRILENGVVGEADVAAAAAAYKSAAEKGSVGATYRLAWLYFIGADGFPRDRAKARQLFEKAARGGDPDAINMVSALSD